MQKFLQRFPPAESTDTVCTACIGDEILKSFFVGSHVEKCNICGNSEYPTTSGVVLANTARSIIQDHFETRPQGSQNDVPLLTLREVLEEITGIDNSEFCQMMAEHIVNHPRDGEDGFFDLEQVYLDVHKVSEQEKWTSVALDLTHRQRYFNKKAEKFFETLLDEALNAKSKTLFGNLPAAVKVVHAGKQLYRARKSDPSIEHDLFSVVPENATKALGAPPPKKSAHNRMSPAGISLFYGAECARTAIAEIRPSIGDKIAVGKFKVMKELKLFDFRGFNIMPLRQKVSHWYDDYKDRVESRKFLSRLHHAVSQPVSSGDNGYVITQAFTEYLLNHPEHRFDGLIFNSVQHNSGVNYVLFPGNRISHDLIGEQWEPEFPVELAGQAVPHIIKGIEYSWDE